MVTTSTVLREARAGQTARTPAPCTAAGALAAEASADATRRPVLACHRKDVFISAQFAVTNVECEAGSWVDLRAFTPSEDSIVLVRTGRFGRRLRGSFSLLDSTQAYLHYRGEEELIQHVSGVGHRCTVISLRSPGFPTAVRLRSRLAHTEFRTTPKTDLAHRLVLAACRRRDDPTTISAMLASLVDDLLLGCERSSRRSGRATTAAAARRVVDSARENMDSLVGAPALGSIAAAASVSPQQMARVFKASTGLTLGQYRSRVRVRLALERLAQGEPDLSRLAHDLGYFDHSHFSRTLTAELGLPPRTLREQLVDRTT